MTKRMFGTGLAVALALVCVTSAQATVLFDFETGVQGWYRFGPATLDFGPTDAGSVDNGIYYASGFGPGVWGGAVKSPDLPSVGIDMTDYSGFSADVKLTQNTPSYSPGNVQVELMFQLPGYLEWAKVVNMPIDDTYYTIQEDFANLVPQNSATMPITQAQLADPSLEIRVLVRNLLSADGDPAGRFVMRVDQVQGIPEPASLALLGAGALMLVSRRRR